MNKKLLNSILLRNLLLITMMLVCGSTWATDVSFDVVNGNASQYSSYINQTVNLTLSGRTFTAGEWTGVCFPFSASKEQLDATFGEGKYTIEEFSSFDGTTIKFTIMKDPAVIAGIPYIIKVNTTIASPTFNGVTFASSLGADDTNFGTQDDNGHVTIADNLNFKGYYFKKDAYKLEGSQGNPVTSYWIKADGTLINKRVWPDQSEFPSEYLGTGAYFSSQTLDQTKLTLSLEQPANTGGGEGGEGGEVTPDLTTLAGKIAARVQLTDAPTIYIDIPDVTNLDADLTKDRGTNTAEYHYATIKVVATDDVNSPHYLESFEETNPLDLQIKVRGNSTSAPVKRPYRLKFAKKSNSSDQKAHKHDLIGGGYTKRNWALLANYFDRSMLRNALTYHLGKAIGMDFCPGYKFVDLVINNNYRGTYQVSDHCEVDANRINVDEDTGWYIEAARQDMCEEPKINAGGADWSIKNPEYDTDAENEKLKTDVSEWLNKWDKSIDQYNNNPTLASSIKGWRAYSDEESFVKFYLAINITGDYDGFMTVKAYREADGKLFLGPLWDKDLAFGNYTDDDGETLAQNFENGMLGGKFTAILKDPIFVSKLKTEMDRLIDNKLVDNLCDKVDEMAKLIENTRKLNYDKWEITSGENVWASYHDYSDYQQYVDDLKAYLRKHIAFIKKHVDDTYASVVGDPTDATYNPENEWYSQNLTMTKVLNETVANRQLKGNEWNTICFPFSATQAQMEEALGCKYELKIHSGMAEDGETMLFTTPETLDISAAYPYLIKPVSDVSSMVFKSVINTDCANQTANYNGEGVTFDNVHYFYGTLFKAPNIETGTDYQFTNDVYTSENSLTHFTSNTTFGARAFIRVSDGSAAKISLAASEPVVRTQLSDVPTVYIDTAGGVDIQPSTGGFVNASIEVLDKNSMIGGGFTETSSNMEIRGRGKTEWAVADGKKSYRIRFAKDEKDASGNVTVSHKHDMTNGGYTKRNWLLLANAADESLVRNALTDELGQAMGFEFTPHYQYVDLYINNVYQGTYLATDHVEADLEDGVTRRVPVDEKYGWLLDMVNKDGIGDGDVYIEGTDAAYPYINIKNPEPGKKTGTEDQIKSMVKTFFDTLWKATDGTGIDKTSFINWYIATEVLGNANALTGIYAYKEKDATELKFGPLWGNELSLGNSPEIDMTDIDTEGSYKGMVYNSGVASAWKTKLKSLWQQDWFKSAVKERWAELNANGALKATVLDKFTAVKTAQAKANDTASATELTEIETYLGTRFEYLDTKFNELCSESDVLLGDVNGDKKVNVTDVTMLVDYILNKTTTGFIKSNADVNEDGKITIEDVVKLVNIILNK